MKLEPATPATPRRPLLQRPLARGLVPFKVGGAQRCPYCHDGLRAEDDLVACSACRAVYHRECLGLEGVCLTFGCPHAPEAPQRTQTARERWASGSDRWRAARLAVLLGLLLATGGLWLLFGHDHEPILPPPPPHFIDPPRPPRITTTVSAPRSEQVCREGDPIRIRGRLNLSDPHMSYPRSLELFVDGQRWSSISINGDLSFRQSVQLPVGSHTLRIPLPEGHSHHVRVHVQARPVRGTVAPQLDLVGAVKGSEVMVRGKLIGRGPVRVTVRGGGQTFSYRAQAPAPFATVLTLPRVGAHEVVVEVQDAQGRTRTARGVVRRTE